MSQSFTIGLQTAGNVTKEVDAFVASKEAQENFKLSKSKELRDGSKIYKWEATWQPWNFKVQKKLITILEKFNGSEDEDDAYKLVALGEDGGYDRRDNIAGNERFTDFGDSPEILFPQEFDEYEDQAEAVNILQELLKADYDRDISSDELQQLMYDDKVTTYKAFEDLSYGYLHGSVEFRKGIDKALCCLLSFNMKEVAQKIREAVENAA
jgi:hypothetical protein